MARFYVDRMMADASGVLLSASELWNTQQNGTGSSMF